MGRRRGWVGWGGGLVDGWVAGLVVPVCFFAYSSVGGGPEDP